MTDKIALNIAAALDAIVQRESAGYHQQFDASAARLVVQKEKLARLLTALTEVQKQVADYDKIEVFVSPHGHMASAKVDNRRFSISTNIANTKFTVEETYYSYSAGDHVETFHDFDTDDEVLRLVMESIGKFIALQRVVEQRRTASPSS